MRPMSLFERGNFTATVSFTDLMSGNDPRISETSATTLPDYTAAIADSGFPGILSQIWVLDPVSHLELSTQSIES